MSPSERDILTSIEYSLQAWITDVGEFVPVPHKQIKTALAKVRALLQQPSTV